MGLYCEKSNVRLSTYLPRYCKYLMNIINYSSKDEMSVASEPRVHLDHDPGFGFGVSDNYNEESTV